MKASQLAALEMAKALSSILDDNSIDALEVAIDHWSDRLDEIRGTDPERDLLYMCAIQCVIEYIEAKESHES